MTTIRSTCPRCGEVDMRPGHILLHTPLAEVRAAGGELSVYRFTCPACLDPVEKPADRKVAALLLAAGVDLATEDSVLGDMHASDCMDGAVLPDQKGYSPDPAFTLDDVVAFHFLLMDDIYIQDFLEGHLL